MFALPAPVSAHPGQRPSTPSLSGRQIECLAWVQEGKSAYDIGMILGLSARTVEGHLAKVCRNLGVRRRIQAVVRARELGLLGRAEP
ncbi:MAG: helix-turn-helix transcriptional regulator [Caulobacter sp.]|nr:helix-turn-helix transcriptional regulator [Caulobacter sp.]